MEWIKDFLFILIIIVALPHLSLQVGYKHTSAQGGEQLN